MPSKPTDIDALTISIAEDGTASLSGINYDDLRSLLTAASLYRSDHGFEAEVLTEPFPSMTHDNNVEQLHWYLRQRLLLDVLGGRMTDAISPQYGNGASTILYAKTTFAREIAEIEQTVVAAEAEAAATPVTANPLIAITEALTKALREADRAVAKLNRLKAVR